MLVDLALKGDRMGELVLETDGEAGILRLGNVVRPMGGAEVGQLLAEKGLAGSAVSMRAILGDLTRRARSWSQLQPSVALDDVEAAVDGPLSSASLSSASMLDASESEEAVDAVDAAVEADLPWAAADVAGLRLVADALTGPDMEARWRIRGREVLAGVEDGPVDDGAAGVLLLALALALALALGPGLASLRKSM